MASVGPITLYREKSVIHRFANQALHGAEAPAFVLRSNRLTMEISAQSHSDTVVVRGHTIASTMRMAGLVAERFTRDPELFRPDNPYPPDWDALWTRMLSAYERTFNSNIWVSVHVGGDTVFTTKDSPPILAIERMAQGADLDERTVRDATRDLFGTATDTDIVAQHDSQTAVVVTPFSNYLRAAILERKEGRTGSFSISVHHTPTRKVTPHEVLFFAADLIESYNLRQFLDRVPGKETTYATAPEHLQEHIAAAVSRRNELVQFIDGFETANKVQYRPERPVL
ncbi:hypothetical protein [uncultured Rhodospira sp.]|uniref:hypothetical protein n=1 Tax=uncultured Rhodospira sp. TaxID=1936189 RepID=UPI00262CEF66|nr:hypothetical protein [uncultured Rhodospira sp.]